MCYNGEDTSAAIRGAELLNRLNAGKAITRALHYQSIESTNTLAKKLAGWGEPGGLLILADEQTAGRGRLGRAFVSPTGGGLWFSLLLRPPAGQPVAPAVTLIAGLAVCQAIHEAGIMDAAIKWPNDILIQNKKTAGILAESGFDQDQKPFLVLGIGINLTIESFPPELAGIATSIQMATGRTIDRNLLLGSIIQHYFELSDRLAAEGFAVIRHQYIDFSMTIDKDVVLLDPARVSGSATEFDKESAKQRICHCIDIAEDGSIVLVDETGFVFKQNSGEISLRYPVSLERKNP